MVKPLLRTWLVFFLPGARWYHRLMKPGFGHVCALACYDTEDRWVFVDPLSKGTVIELWSHDAVHQRLAGLVDKASLVLRVRQRHDRSRAPVDFWCVGAIKGLLGIRSRALVPSQLARHLLANGAEIVEMPHGKSVRSTGSAAPAPGRPGVEAAA